MKVLSYILVLVVLAGASLPSVAGGQAYLTMYNRSDYPMIYVMWEDGSDCSGAIPNTPGTDLNLEDPEPVVIAAGEEFAVGIGIMEMRGKAPVHCEYVLSFVPEANREYVLEYYVHDRRCFGNMYRVNHDETFVVVEPGDSEGLTEKLPEFGWDQFEPACF